MTVTDEAAPVLVVWRQIAVPRERCLRRGSIRRAWRSGCGRWTSPMPPSPSILGSAADSDCDGGRTDGGDYEHRGEYLAIEPPSLLSFAWISNATDQKPTVVTVEVHERGTGTELVLTHRRSAPKAVDAHREGWTDVGRLLDEASGEASRTSGAACRGHWKPQNSSNLHLFTPSSGHPMLEFDGFHAVPFAVLTRSNVKVSCTPFPGSSRRASDPKASCESSATTLLP